MRRLIANPPNVLAELHDRAQARRFQEDATVTAFGESSLGGLWPHGRAFIAEVDAECAEEAQRKAARRREIEDEERELQLADELAEERNWAPAPEGGEE